MNHANSTIENVSPSTHRIGSRASPSNSAESVRSQDGQRGDELRRISKRGKIDPRLVCLLQPASVLAESYFRLRHAVEEMRNAEHGIVVGVTSPGEGDGKTFTAINLAGALAQDAHARVLLVDLNLRHSGADVRKYLDLQQDADTGVSDWIGSETPGKVPAPYCLSGLNLDLMPSGTSVDAPYKLLASPRLDELFEKARRHYDFIIVDTPQTLLLPDIELIARVVDGFLIVVRADVTAQEKLEETLNLMTPEKVLGLVFNEVAAHR